MTQNDSQSSYDDFVYVLHGRAMLQRTTEATLFIEREYDNKEEVDLKSSSSSTCTAERCISLCMFCHRRVKRWSPISCRKMMMLVLLITLSIGSETFGVSFASASSEAIEDEKQQQQPIKTEPSHGNTLATTDGNTPSEVKAIMTDIMEKTETNIVGKSPTQTVQQSNNDKPTKQQTSKSLPTHSDFTPQGIENLSPPQLTFSKILQKAGRAGMGGGIPGAIAGVVQVLSLMWLRTLTNYQCRYGTSLRQAIDILYREGGILRFYRGVGFAIVQAPLVRFVSTAANDGVQALLGDLKLTQSWGPGRTTVVASVVVGIWRMFLMPIDTCKTVLQVDSVEGFRGLVHKLKDGKVTILYQGALANAAAAVVSHYPWFYTYNYLSRSQALLKIIHGNFLRNAAIGFLSSIVSDSVSNVVRVIKTTKQAFASKHSVSYTEVVSMILAADGWKGLFGRGLRTRILGNAVQSVLFTVIWRGLAEKRSIHR